ncbi:hypothetical protein LTR50_007289 [Elasticomyces elasticus]|nr:hypothetical protein LTR50_007289 [Elasticomyces elasticus]
MSEFIGRTISLVSKSDIRYVGTLHEINSENSTVALENVRSYGTEGRRGSPEEEIAGSDSIYEYIVFRGSDVKHLNIEDPPKENKPPPPQVPNDPAILGSARPHPQQAPQPSPHPPNNQQDQQNQRWGPPQGPPHGPLQPHPYSPYGYSQPPFQQQPRFAPPGGPHGFPGAPGAVPGYGMPYGPPQGWYPPPPGQGFPQGPPGPFSPPQQPQMPIGPPGMQQTRQQPSNAPQPGPVSTGPKQPTPQPPAEKSATPLPAAQLNPASNLPMVASAISTAGKESSPAPTASKPEVASAVTAPSQPAMSTAPSKQIPTGPKNNRVAVPLAASAARPQAPLQTKSSNAPQVVSQPSTATATAAQQFKNATQQATAAVAAAMAKLNPQATQQGQVAKDPAQPGDTHVDNLTKKVSEMRTDSNIRHSRQPGTGGYAAGHRGGRGGRRSSNQAQTHAKPVEVPNVDFDFERSNAKFNKQDLVKEAIASGSPMGTPGADKDELALPAVNGSSSHTAANGADHEDVTIPAPTSAATYKKADFFDNISSELKDRVQAQEEGKRLGGPEFRGEERRKNMETFGLGSVDGNGYRSGYRGRGRGRGFGRGRGGGGIGGGRGGFAPRGRGGPQAVPEA